MGTTARDEDGGGLGIEEAYEPIPVSPRPDARRRLGTIAAFALVGVVAWAIVSAAGGSNPDDDADTATGAEVGDSALPAGTYRLPGISTPVTVTLPDGWRAGDSIWGPASPGIAAVSTGRQGASISLAVFDLRRLQPYAAAVSRPLDRPGNLAWFRRSLDDYRDRVEPRVHDRIVGDHVDPRTPAVLAWLLTHTDRRPIDVADDVTIGGVRGTIVSFSFPGPTSSLFGVAGPGSIALLPGNTYTFWVPTDRGALAHNTVLGIAREPGAVTGTAEWDVVHTLGFGE